jgi:hypothetical protein
VQGLFGDSDAVTLPQDFSQDLRACVDKNRPFDEPAKWETAARPLRSKVDDAKASGDLVEASGFKSAFTKLNRGYRWATLAR